MSLVNPVKTIVVFYDDGSKQVFMPSGNMSKAATYPFSTEEVKVSPTTTITFTQDQPVEPNSYGKRVIHNGTTYTSIRDAVAKTGLHRYHVVKNCDRGAYGWKWE